MSINGIIVRMQVSIIFHFELVERIIEMMLLKYSSTECSQSDLNVFFLFVFFTKVNVACKNLDHLNPNMSDLCDFTALCNFFFTLTTFFFFFFFHRSCKLQIRNIPPHMQWEVSAAFSRIRRHSMSIIVKPTRHNKNTAPITASSILLLLTLFFVSVVERHAQMTSLSTGLRHFLVPTVGANAAL